MNEGFGAARTRRLLALLAIVGVLAIAAYLHFGAVLRTQVYIPLMADAGEYVSYAYNLQNHDTYSRQPSWTQGWSGIIKPDGVRQPGYPLFLSTLLGERVDDAFVLRVTMVQALLSVGYVFLAFQLARSFFSLVPSLLISLLVAITPQLVTSTTYVLTETLYTFLFTAFLLALVCLLRGHRTYWWLAALTGLLLGLSALVRPTSIYLPLVLVPMLVMFDKRVRRSAWLVLGFVVAYGPWVAWNQMELGRSSDPTLSIATLQHGSYPNFMYEGRPESYGYPYMFDPRTPEIVRSTGTVMAHIASEFRREPVAMLRWYLIQKPICFVSWEPIQGAGDVFVYPVVRSPYVGEAFFGVSRSLMKALHVPLMFLGMIGSVFVVAYAIRERFAPGRARMLGALGVLFLAIVGLHVIGAPFPRYSLPFRPMLLIFAASLCVWAVERLRTVASPRLQLAAD